MQLRMQNILPQSIKRLFCVEMLLHNLLYAYIQIIGQSHRRERAISFLCTNSADEFSRNDLTELADSLC